MKSNSNGYALGLGACPVQSAAGLQPVPSFKGSNVF